MTKLTTYIEQELRKGFSREEITNVLLKYGYDKEGIKRAFDEVGHLEFAQHAHQRLHFGKMVFGIVISIIVILAILLTLSMYETSEVEIGDTDQDVFQGEALEVESVAEQQAAFVSDAKQTKCDQLQADQKDLCYLKQSAEQDVTNFCYFIDDYFVATACWKQSWNTDVCQYNTLLGENTDKCYLKEALAKKDITFCIKSDQFETCIGELVKVEENIDICNGDFTCVVAFARFYEDLNVCESEFKVDSEVSLCKNLVQ